MRAGYSYTTITAGRDESPQIQVTFILDDQAQIRVPGAGRGRCHLAVSHGDVSVAFAPTMPDSVTAMDVEMARQLAEAAATYLAEMERHHNDAARSTAA